MLLYAYICIHNKTKTVALKCLVYCEDTFKRKALVGKPFLYCLNVRIGINIPFQESRLTRNLTQFVVRFLKYKLSCIRN